MNLLVSFMIGSWLGMAVLLIGMHVMVATGVEGMFWKSILMVVIIESVLSAFYWAILILLYGGVQ